MKRTFVLLLTSSLLPSLAVAQEVPRAPSDAELTQHRVQMLTAEMTYAQALINRLTAELAASEARGKWAVDKLWRLPVTEKKGGS